MAKNQVVHPFVLAVSRQRQLALVGAREIHRDERGLATAGRAVARAHRDHEVARGGSEVLDVPVREHRHRGHPREVGAEDRVSLRGSAQRICLEHVMDCYVIWKFAENIAGAKQFLVDYIDNFRQGFLGSEFYNFPCFPSTVPDLKKMIEDDSKAKPRDKYKVLGSLMAQATNVGYPGYANAAIDEIFNTWVLNTMFARAATGDATPEDAIRDAEAACKRIFAKWQARGLV